ncbi:unnamed protein product [Meganyctiphanes norvegica]|uniref:DUF4116 domain-containing protein n=1 Tax=Meganyctiphanes norvegica TaxID=48144 RepID=A0AAV2PRW8_MEGNR
MKVSKVVNTVGILTDTTKKVWKFHMNRNEQKEKNKREEENHKHAMEKNKREEEKHKQYMERQKEQKNKNKREEEIHKLSMEKNKREEEIHKLSMEKKKREEEIHKLSMEKNKREEENHKHFMEKQNDKDSEFVKAATDGDIKTLTFLSKRHEELSLEYVQLAHNIAKNKKNPAVIKITKLTLDKKKNEKDSEFVKAATDGDIKTLTFLSKRHEELSLEYVQIAHDIANSEKSPAVIKITQLTLDKKKKFGGLVLGKCFC